MTIRPARSLFGALALAGLVPPLALSPLAAQSQGPDQSQSQSPGQDQVQGQGQGNRPVPDISPVCMAGAFRDVPQNAGRRGQPFRVVVAAVDVRALEERGFALAECGAADLVSQGQRARWRDEVCAMAAFGNEAVQNQFERALGARPAHLCGSAKLAVGRE